MGVQSPSEKRRSHSWTQGTELEPIRKLKSFNELLSQYENKSLFIGIDLDETVIMTEQSPSWLLTSFGVTSFQTFVSKLFPDFETRNKLCRELQVCLKRKILVDPDIPSVIRKLQQSGSYVFGLTARYANMAQMTETTLSALGIDFGLKSPFPDISPKSLSGAMCRNGVIYCNATQKGTIFREFLHSLTQHAPLTACPGFVFIDDNLQQLSSLQAVNDGTLPFHYHHYQAACLVDDETGMDPHNLAFERGRILLKQMQMFVDEKRVISNQSTRELLSRTS